MTSRPVVDALLTAHGFCWRYGVCTASALDPGPHHGEMCRAMERRDLALARLTPDEIAALAGRILADEAKTPPAARFAEMVAAGLIDADGKPVQR